MKEIFNIRRFGALAGKFYRENMKTHLLFVAVMFVATFLCICKFNPFETEYHYFNETFTREAFIFKYKQFYFQVFWGLLWLSSVFVALYAFKEVMSRHKAVNALLLPASTFEKYLLAVLHSTVVVLVLNLAVFYAAASVANSYKYEGLKSMTFTKGWFGQDVPILAPGEKVEHPQMVNVFSGLEEKNLFYYKQLSEDGKVHRHRVSFSSVLGKNLVVISWLFFISFFMWGSITFRKQTALLTILFHCVLWGILGWIAFKLSTISGFDNHWAMFKNLFIAVKYPDIYMSPWWLLLFYIFPATYLTVVWLKLKNKQL